MAVGAFVIAEIEKRGIMMKLEPMFAQLLKLFIDTDRLKKWKDKKQHPANEQDNNDQKDLTEIQTSSNVNAI